MKRSNKKSERRLRLWDTSEAVSDLPTAALAREGFRCLEFEFLKEGDNDG